MTNRERLMQEFAAMSDETLFDLITNCSMGQQLNDRLCFACEAAHGDVCPVGDGNCLLWDGHWLREEWDGTPILMEVRSCPPSE